MTNAVLEKRFAKLEAEIQRIKRTLPPVAEMRRPTANAPLKKLPRGLQIALREFEEGKIIGPFDSHDAFMVDLNKK